MAAEKRIPVLIWHKCYDQGWKGMIHPKSFSHPAKFARGLIERIVDHGIKKCWFKGGELIGDPFGGVALGGLVCAYRGLRWVGVELEWRFVHRARANIISAARRKWIDGPLPIILQGDSRRFSQIVNSIITSPPYADSVNSHGHGIDWSKCPTVEGRARGEGTAHEKTFCDQLAYGGQQGQIGRLSAGGLDAVLASPPYSPNVRSDRTAESRDERAGHRQGKGCFRTSESYGRDAKQIGGLQDGGLDAVLTSPPYGAIRMDGGGLNLSNEPQGGIIGAYCEGTTDRRANHRDQQNIGNLAMDGIVTSPPWEDQESAMNASKFRDPEKFAAAMTRLDGAGARYATTQQSRLAQFSRQTEATYGEAAGQIGNVTGQTYWEAMAQVYAQCLLSLKPGGIMCIVVKDYVAKKKRVPLCDQTLRLLTHLGFTPVCRIRAMLVKRRHSVGVFGQAIEDVTERKSFFRRLAEKKGSPRIDYEEVLVVRKENSGIKQLAFLKKLILPSPSPSRV